METRDAGDESGKRGSEVKAKAAATDEGRKIVESVRRDEGEMIHLPMIVTLNRMIRTLRLLTIGGTKESTDGDKMTVGNTNAKKDVKEVPRTEREKENVTEALKGVKGVKGVADTTAKIEGKMMKRICQMIASMPKAERKERIESTIIAINSMFAFFFILDIESEASY